MLIVYDDAIGVRRIENPLCNYSRAGAAPPLDVDDAPRYDAIFA